MKSTHVWQRKEDTVLGDGKPGYFIECDGCSNRLSVPEDASQFSIDIAVIMHFCMLVIDDISSEECDARTVPMPDSRDKGYHGVLAENCDEAREFNVLSVMEM